MIFLAPPKFLKGGIADQRLKVGETIKYEVPISGEPTPEVSWTVNGKPLKVGGRVKMTTERGKHILKVSKQLLVMDCDYREIMNVIMII